MKTVGSSCDATFTEPVAMLPVAWFRQPRHEQYPASTPPLFKSRKTTT